MSKPWDKLRTPIEPVKYRIWSGEWRTSGYGINIAVNITQTTVGITTGTFACPSIQGGCAGDLREIAEFCTELADQLESRR